ncbi:Ig-like domain-containing protein [Limnoglobus roseus]|uniref:Beta-propeller repeat protein n=1 Tax=Limnoglobus roseus TaxID=2598579 RepID=A0A5C1ADY5_9BACT|nr:Ig-like domain-containing protein [Limnoglobus roseus]QEL15922.1 beta-propeller repeat protein [Limnoglobus roseus]
MSRKPFAPRSNRLPWQLQVLEDRTQPATTESPGGILERPPTANDDFVNANGTNAITIAVLDNDAAVGARNLNPASVALLTPPTHGTASVDASSGSITYTPTGSFHGTDTLSYTVSDSAGQTSNPAKVTIVVNRPTANDDFAETDVNTAVSIPVIENDSAAGDAGGAAGLVASSVRIFALPLHGSVVVTPATGEVVYTPDTNFSGTDNFQYTVKDTAGAESSAGYVTVVVNPPATPPATNPIARDDVADTDGTNPVDVPVLDNDSAATGRTLNLASVNIVGSPSRGTVSVDPATGVVTYTATGFFTGTDTFTYTVADSAQRLSNTATVTIVVNRPAANDDSADTDGTNPVEVDVLANDTDPDGNEEIDPATVRVLSQPANGTVTVNTTTGAITYTATGFFQGTDTFQYTVKDKAGAESAPGTVTIVVNRPTANEDAAFTTSTAPVAINVLANDTDPDGNGELDPASVAVVSGPAHGTAAVDPATGAITYTPNGTYIGTDVFTYTVTDFPGAVSNAATVRVRVNATASAQLTVAAADVGGGPRVTVFNADGSDRASFFAYDPSFTGGVRVASGDVNGDGVPDIVTAPGKGGGALVKVFDGKTLALISSYTPYDSSFTGDVYVAAGDVNGDGKADIITGAGAGGGPHVLVHDVATGRTVMSFFAYDSSFRGGVDVATGDVNGDGKADIITGSGIGGGPHVKVFSGADGSVLQSFFAYDSSFRGGVTVAAGDLNGDGLADVITGTNAGGGPAVSVFDGSDRAVLASFFAFDSANRGGVRVSAADVNGDGRADILASSGPGQASGTKAFDGVTFAQLQTDDPFGDFNGGVFVGGPG